MGGCCAKQQEDNLDSKISIQYSVEETNGIMKTMVKPELKFEDNKLEMKEEEVQLAKIFNKLQYLYKNKVKIFTEIELFNLAILYRDNYMNSDYLVFDMRMSCEQKEDYLKKIRHINYTFEQIRNIRKINKLDVLESFIDNKNIIIIIPEYYLDPKNDDKGYIKAEEYPIELCYLLYNINNSISFRILNTCFDKPSLKTKKFEEYLSVFHSYDIIPFILFSYKHVTTFYKEGYFFISFLDTQIFSFEDYINNINETKNNKDNNEQKNESNLKYKFLKEMNITTIVNIDNEIKSSFDVNDFQYKKSVFKEISINKNDIKNGIRNINSIYEWLKQEIKKGHSCYFNIKNYYLNDIDSEEIQENNWIFIIIILITLVAEVEYTSVINYLREKMIYINNIDREIDDNIIKDEILKTLEKY